MLHRLTVGAAARHLGRSPQTVKRRLKRGTRLLGASRAVGAGAAGPAAPRGMDSEFGREAEAAARAVLGEEAFASARAEGCGLSPEQARALASAGSAAEDAETLENAPATA